MLERLTHFLRNFQFGTSDYAFWLLVVSSCCFALERLFPWRPQQRALRSQFPQDLFWLAFNGHLFGVMWWMLPFDLGQILNQGFAKAGLRAPDSLALLAVAPVWVQLAALLVVKDFVDWCVHNLLHRVPWLWQIHKVHHSIEQLDWIGNFRFHWGETLIYRTLTYLPLVVLGVQGRLFLWHGILATVIGHLNHSNLKINWGPLKYVLNSSQMHVWHHDYLVRGTAGVNFGVVLSCWDWLFGTAHAPGGQPERLGFDGIDRFPKSWLGRALYPLSALLPKA